MSNYSLPAWGTGLPSSEHSLNYTRAKYYLPQNTCLLAVICRSCGELSTNEKKGKNTLNDNNICIIAIIIIIVTNRTCLITAGSISSKHQTIVREVILI